MPCFFCMLCVVVVVLVLPIARGRPGNWRLLTKTTMPYTAHTVCPTGISGPYVTKGIFHTGLNRLGIRNKLEIHNISILLIEARKEVGGSVVTTTTRAIGWGSSCWDTQQGGQLLFNEPLEEENFTVGRMFHQSFDEIRHLQYKIKYISQQQKISVKTHTKLVNKYKIMLCSYNLSEFLFTTSLSFFKKNCIVYKMNSSFLWFFFVVFTKGSSTVLYLCYIYKAFQIIYQKRNHHHLKLFAWLLLPTLTSFFT